MNHFFNQKGFTVMNRKYFVFITVQKDYLKNFTINIMILLGRLCCLVKRSMTLKKISLIVCLFIFLALPFLALPVLAQPDLGTNYAVNLELVTTDQDPRDAIVNIVRYLMTFLGVIAVVMILYGGFRWMYAGGNEDEVASAKKIIIAAAIGLVAILTAFATVTFVIDTTGDMLANGTI